MIDGGLGPAVNTVAIVLCVAFLAYVASILVPFLRQTPSRPGRSRDIVWHLLVPCLDEEAVVERTVRRLLATAPEAHLWCIDDASDDATPLVLAALAAEDPRVHVVSRVRPMARQGKGPALNAGWAAVSEHLRLLQPDVDRSRVVVGVLDADGRLDPFALNILAGPDVFGIPEVGAAQIQVRMLNRGKIHVDGNDPAAGTWLGRALVDLQDVEFRTVISAMQLLRRRLGSVGMGGNGQFTRMSVLDQIADGNGVPWQGALLEDFELGLQVLLAGHRNQYCDDTWVAQEALPTASALIRQRTRWAQGGMQCSKYLPAVLKSAKLSTPAALEIAYFLLIPWTQLVGSVVYATALGIMGYYAVTTPGGVTSWFSGGGWGVFLLALMFGIAPVALWGPVYRRRCEPTTTRVRALVLGLLHWVYTYVLLIAVWKAFVRLLRSQSGWVKTSRVRSTSPDSVLSTGRAGVLSTTTPALGRPVLGTTRGVPTRGAHRAGRVA